MLATSPNSGIPAGLRRPAFDDVETATGHAAAIMFVAPDGDILLCRRSPEEKNYGGYWALPGGKAEDGETPEQCAAREASEELGEVPEGRLRLLDRRQTPTGMAFHTFAAPVDEKFQPHLNGEHVGYAWFPLDGLPEQVHPGVAATVKDRLTGEDMAPEDWDGLRTGFVRWTLEEEAEPEHASDEKPAEHEATIRWNGDFNWKGLLRHLHRLGAVGASRPVNAIDEEDEPVTFGWDGDGADKLLSAMIDGEDVLAGDAMTDSLRLAMDSVRTFDKDGRMRVERAHISKANVCPYKGSEIPGWEELGLEPDRIYQLYRDPGELKKAAPSSNGVQVLQKHIKVSADDPQQWDVVGATGTDDAFDGEYLNNSLSIWTRSAIKGIESNECRELSMGYHYRADMTPGKIGDTEFDGVMRDIVVNHVALVGEGRAGPDVVVGDSMEGLMADKKPTRIAALALGLTARAVNPLLAADAKVNYGPVFAGVTSKTFDAKKLYAGVSSLVKGKIAADAGLKHVADMLSSLEKATQADPKTADESVSEPQHKAMMAAAEGRSNIGIPKDVGEEFRDEDKGKTFDGELPDFLRSKGMGDDDIERVMGMMPKPAAGDEDLDDEDKEAKKDDDDKGEKKPPGKDRAMAGRDKGISKDQLDATLKAALDAQQKKIMADQRDVRIALDEVRPYVGDIRDSLAFDSAADVRRHALKMLGVEGHDTIHESALSTILKMQPKAGAKAAPHSGRIAVDSATAKGFAERFPDASRITAA